MTKNNKKSIRISSRTGEKVNTVILRRAYTIILYMKNGYIPTQIATRLAIKRETLQYWIDKLEAEGLIYCTNPHSNKYKQYETTPAGESFLVANESTVKQKKIVTTENARFKCYIRNHNNFLPFLQHTEYGFKKTPSLKNNIVYDGNVEGIKVRIIHGAKHIDNVTLLMIAPKFSGMSAKEAEFLMFRSMLQFQDWLDKKWNLDLTRISIDSTHVEYTWESHFAKAIMTKTKGSPVKSGLFSINQSPPSLTPKEEWHDADEMDKHILLPDIVDSIKKEIEEIKNENYNVSYSMEKLENVLTDLSNHVKNLSEEEKISSSNMAILATKMTDLVHLIQSKTVKPESKIEENHFPLNNNTRSIYG